MSWKETTYIFLAYLLNNYIKMEKKEENHFFFLFLIIGSIATIKRGRMNPVKLDSVVGSGGVYFTVI